MKPYYAQAMAALPEKVCQSAAVVRLTLREPLLFQVCFDIMDVGFPLLCGMLGKVSLTRECGIC